jgi:hypothetical protein
MKNFLLALAAVCVAFVIPSRSHQTTAPENKLFCTTSGPICFELAAVSLYSPSERALVMHAGYSVVLTQADWDNLVQFGHAAGYEFPGSSVNSSGAK